LLHFVWKNDNFVVCSNYIVEIYSYTSFMAFQKGKDAKNTMKRLCRNWSGQVGVWKERENK